MGGDLTLRYVQSEVDLSGVEYVDGEVYIYDAYGDIDLGNLADIGGSYSNYYQYYNTTDLSGVETIGGDMRWYYTAYYSSSDVDVGADNLTEIGGQLYLYQVAGYYGGSVTAEFPSPVAAGMDATHHEWEKTAKGELVTSRMIQETRTSARNPPLGAQHDPGDARVRAQVALSRRAA